jgi:SAM-dependent methyltransferase
VRTTMLNLARVLGERVRLPEPIYEFGARRVPGQEHRGEVRRFFRGRRCVGTDAEPGEGVDVVLDLHRLDLPEGAIGTALIFDTIEHVRDPRLALTEIHRCLAPGGVVVLTSVMYFPVHAYPDDYWRFTTSGFAVLLAPFHLVALRAYGVSKLPHTVLGVGSKGPLEPTLERDLVAAIDAWSVRGARTWKEVAMALAPPALLVPAYDAFMWALKRLGSPRGGRA